MLREKFIECATSTGRAEGKLAADENFNIASMSGRTFFSYHAQAESVPRTPQTTTVARHREERDPRNFYTWAVLLYSYCENLLPEFVFNWDATTFSCGSDEHNKLKVHVRVAVEQSTPLSRIGGSLGVYIKKIFLHNSAGQVAAPIYVIADDDMDQSVFEYY